MINREGYLKIAPAGAIGYMRLLGGTWNERFMVETDFSWLTELFHVKKLFHRVQAHLTVRLRYLAALINCLLRLADGKRSLAEFVI